MDRFPERIAPSPATVANSQRISGLEQQPRSVAAARPAMQAAVPANQLGALFDGMTARLDALEQQVRQLQSCTLQQWPDGRVHLPAGRVRIEIGGTRLKMDLTTFSVEANGQILVSTRPDSSGGTPTQQAGGLQSMAPSAGGWQSTAQQNAISNPRTLGSGTRLSPP